MGTGTLSLEHVALADVEKNGSDETGRTEANEATTTSVVEKLRNHSRKLLLHGCANRRSRASGNEKSLHLLISQVEGVLGLRSLDGFGHHGLWGGSLGHHLHLLHGHLSRHHLLFNSLGLSHEFGNRSRVHGNFIFTDIFFLGILRNK